MKYRKKPVVIEAIQFGPEGNAAKILQWANDMGAFIRLDHKGLHVKTLEGEMLAQRGDWIIKGIKNEFYPCKPDIFEMTYEVIT
jgi:hypothetical protein